MEFLILGILTGLISVILFFYYQVTRNFSYWKIRHVSGPQPIPLFGNVKDILLSRQNVPDFFKEIYDAYPHEPAVGIFITTKQTLLLRDLEMIKDVLIRNFVSFADRGVNFHKDIEPLAQHLVFLEFERWKPLRKMLTPVFSSGKLREMFYLINECAGHFKDYLDNEVAKGEPIECRELTAKFTTDVIGVCAFGLNMNSMSDNSEFRKIGQKIFANTLSNRFRILVRMIPHWFARFLKPIARDDKMIDFFLNIIKDTIEYRKEMNNIRRNDFVDLLSDTKNYPNEIGEEGMTDMLITAQAFVFFLAGFETSSTTISHAMYELALNVDIQNKLREEINETFKNNKEKIDYESISHMKYLDKIFKETLRKYPPVSILPRIARSDHTFTNSNISITKGTKILIPVYAIHHDPNIYPEPEKFDPDRFNEETTISSRHMSYLPFGDGPRNCIGERFARNQTKLGLAIAVKYFKFKVCDKTCLSYEKRKNTPLVVPKDGLYLKIEKFNSS